jgi:hypothetical protein
MFSAIYRDIVGQLVAAAEAKASPADAAAEITTQLPDEFDPMLYKLVHRADLLAYLASFDARIRDHSEWLAAVQAEIQSMYEKPADETPEPARA